MKTAIDSIIETAEQLKKLCDELDTKLYSMDPTYRRDGVVNWSIYEEVVRHRSGQPAGARVILQDLLDKAVHVQSAIFKMTPQEVTALGLDRVGQTP